jgi:hypothetical protein
MTAATAIDEDSDEDDDKLNELDKLEISPEFDTPSIDQTCYIEIRYNRCWQPLLSSSLTSLTSTVSFAREG